jgi:hypothetical protein
MYLNAETILLLSINLLPMCVIQQFFRHPSCGRSLWPVLFHAHELVISIINYFEKFNDLRRGRFLVIIREP